MTANTTPTDPSTDTETERASPAKQFMGRGCAVLFFGLFFVLGVGVGVKLVIDVRHEYEVPRVWTRTECRLVSKDVETHHSTDSDGHSSTTYSPQFTFSYQVAGSAITATGYKRFQLSSSYGWANSVLKRYTVGGTYPCWVNPADPQEAVLEHGVTWRHWLLFLLPIAFIGIGGGGGYFALTTKMPTKTEVRQQRLRHAKAQAPKVRTRSGQRLRLRLLPESSALGRFLGMLLFCAIWLGGTGFMTYQILKDGWGPALLFAAIFWLFGLIIVGILFHTFLYLLLVGDPRLEISAEPVRVGEPFSIYLQHERSFAVQRVTVKLVANAYRGDEESEGRQLRPDALLEEVVLERAAAPLRPLTHIAIEQSHTLGEAAARILARDDAEAIGWALQVALDISRRPDIDLKFPLRVESADISKDIDGLVAS